MNAPARSVSPSEAVGHVTHDGVARLKCCHATAARRVRTALGLVARRPGHRPGDGGARPGLETATLPAHHETERSDLACRHCAGCELPRLRTARSRERPPKTQQDPRRRSYDPHARTRPLLPEGAPAAPRAR